MSDPRVSLNRIAELLRSAAIDAHSEGMALLERSVRIAQLATVCNDEQAEQLLAHLQSEGLVTVLSSAINADGGDA